VLIDTLAIDARRRCFGELTMVAEYRDIEQFDARFFKQFGVNETEIFQESNENFLNHPRVHDFTLNDFRIEMFIYALRLFSSRKCTVGILNEEFVVYRKYLSYFLVYLTVNSR